MGEERATSPEALSGGLFSEDQTRGRKKHYWKGGAIMGVDMSKSSATCNTSRVHPGKLCLLLPALMLAGTAEALPVKYQARFNAKVPAVADLRVIAVMPFTGQDSENFTGGLIAALQSATVDGEPWFTLKSGDGFQASAPTAAEISAAVKYGRAAGAEVVYIGKVATASVNAVPRQEARATCVQPGPKLFSPCQRQETFAVNCQRVDGNYTVTPRAIRVSDGSVVYSQSITFTEGYDGCDDRPPSWSTAPIPPFGLPLPPIFRGRPKTVEAAPSPDTLLQRLRDKALQRVRSDVAPYNGEITVNVKEKGTDLPKEAAAQFKSGVDFAKGGRMDRACGIWDTINTGPAAESPTLLYNLGACAEVLEPDNPRVALGYYSKADALLTKPDNEISAALKRMQTAGAR